LKIDPVRAGFPAAAFLMLLPIILSLIPIILERGIPIMTEGDIALLEISTLDVESGVYSGAYSRMGFHHPGPIYFYLRYPFYRLSGYNSSSFYFSAAFIVSVALLLSAVLVRRLVSAGHSLLFCSVASAYLFSIQQSIWLSQWNPFIVIFPLLLLAFTTSSSTVRPAYLLGSIAAGSFCSQTHIGLLPVSLVLIAYSASVISSGRRWTKRIVLYASALFIVLWGPVLYGELFPPESGGNLQSIWTSFSSERATGVSLPGVSAWVSSIVPIETMLLGRSIRGMSLSPLKIMAVISACRLLLLSAVWIFYRRRQIGFLYHLCLVIGLLHVTSLVSIFSIRGELHQYLTTWMSVISPLSWFAVLGIFPYIIRGKPWKYAVWIPVAAAGYFSFLSARAETLEGFSPDPLGYHSEDVESLLSQSRDLDPAGQGLEIEISIQNDSLWPEMVGLALQLRKSGCAVEIPGRYVFMLHQHREVDAPHSLIITDEMQLNSIDVPE